MAEKDGGSQEEVPKGFHGEELFLPPIREQDTSDTDGDPVVLRPTRRPFSVSPRRFDPQEKSSSDSSSDTDEDTDEYEKGLIGSTPPKAQRLTKTRRRSHKFRRITSPYQEYKEKQKAFSKTRPTSADMILLPDFPPFMPPSNQLRRHTVGEVSSKNIDIYSKKTLGFNSYSSIDNSKSKKDSNKEGGGKKKKKDKVRRQDRDDKREEQQHGRSPTSLDNVPQLNIVTPFVDLTQATPIKEGPAHLSVKHPLYSSLTSHELSLRMTEGEEEEGVPRVVRSQSDAQLSLNLLSSQSIRCPSDRNKFYKNFRKTLSMISKRQQQGSAIHQSGFHMPRQHSENLGLENPFNHMVDQIWYELRAWQANRSKEEQEDWDFEHFREVEIVLNRIMQYRFDENHSNVLSSGLFSGTERERDDYEPLMSLTTASKEGEVNDPALSDEATPLNSLTPKITSGHTHFEDDTDEGPQTLTQQALTQQASTDSDESSTSSKSSGEYAIDKFLMPKQLSALSEVNQLLEDLECVEGLYANSKKVGDENPKYRQHFFRRKRDTLILWSKVTSGLANHLSRLSKWFGVPIIVQSPTEVQTPCTPSRSTSDSTSHPLSGLSFSDNTDPEASLGGFSRLSSIQFLSQASQRSSISSTRSNSNRHFSPRTISNVESYPSLWKGYRKFVDRTLKKKGLEWLIDQLLGFLSSVFTIAEEAIKVRSENVEDGYNEEVGVALGGDPSRESWPLLFMKPHPDRQVFRSTSTTPRCWLDEFFEMNLPPFDQLYIQLARVVLDVMQECMRQKTEVNKNIKPSAYSIRKLIQECHMTISKGVEVRSFYRQKAHLLISNNPGRLELVDADMAAYEKDLKDMLQLYFSYVTQLVDVIGTYREMLEEEWVAAKRICMDIANGEVEAGLNFSHLASQLMEKLQDDLQSQIDTCCDELHDISLHEYEDQKQPFIESCRAFKEIIQSARESAMKSLGFAKSLMKDLEIAANFSIRGTSHDLLQVLRASDHVQVTIPQQKSCMLFIPHQIADKQHEIQELLHVSFGRTQIEDDLHPSSPLKHGFGAIPVCYLLVVRFIPSESIPIWTGQTIDLVPSAENILSICEMQVEGIKMIVRDSQQLDECRNSFFRSVGSVVEIADDKTSSYQSVAERISDLKHVICRFGHSLLEVVDRVNSNLSLEEVSEREDVLDRYRSTMHACYNFAFEYIKEVTRLLGEEFVHQKMGVELLTFAEHWMMFVNTKCARGYGKIPRWSAPGLEFLLLACGPRVLASMSSMRYESLRKQMDKCLEHLVGDNTTVKGMGGGELSRLAFSPVGGVPNRPGTWQRPSGRRRPPNNRTLSVQSSPIHHSPLVQRRNAPNGTILESDRVDGSSPPVSNDSITSSGIDSPTYYGTSNPLDDSGFSIPSASLERIDSHLMQYYNNMPDFATSPGTGHISDWGNREERKKQTIEDSCRNLDIKREKLLRERRVIGHEIKATATAPQEFAKLAAIRQTHFNWRRGRKLGEGQFGKVYECVNLDKGEVNAVKMISLLDKSHNKVRDILSEIKVFLQINHPNIVHLFGVEVHHTELYIFMEYCNQGTLWSAVRQGLTERMIRIYTRDLLRAVDALHEKGIVHRDIKSGNVFLSDDSIKLGDFGLSIQLRNLNKTAPQEIKDQRGTIPYMAPEVVLKQDMGRPMDIWSVACVVVEMVTSKHPWFECEDNQFAIMFQLGQGNAPPYPREKNPELDEFLDLCFVSEPSERADTTILLAKAFVQVTDEED